MLTLGLGVALVRGTVPHSLHMFQVHHPTLGQQHNHSQGMQAPAVIHQIYILGKMIQQFLSRILLQTLQLVLDQNSIEPPHTQADQANRAHRHIPEQAD